MKKFYENQTEEVKFTGRSFTGIEFLVKTIGDAVNKMPVIGNVDLDKVNLDIVRNASDKITIWNGTLKDLAKGVLLGTDGFMLADGQDIGADGVVDYVTETAGIKGEALFALKVRFFGGQVLKGEDSLVIKVRIESGCFGTEIDSAEGTSYIGIDTIDDITDEPAIPVIDSYPIDANQNTFTMGLGDNVKAITLVNNDQTDALYGSRIINSVTIESDKFTKELDYMQLVALRAEQFVPSVKAANRYQTFNLMPYFDFPLNKVKIRIDLNSANVATGKNLILVQRLHVDPVRMQDNIFRNQKHNAENGY